MYPYYAFRQVFESPTSGAFNPIDGVGHVLIAAVGRPVNMMYSVLCPCFPHLTVEAKLRWSKKTVKGPPAYQK